MKRRVHRSAERRGALEILRDRWEASARLVDHHAAALAEANTRMLAEPGSPEARRQLEDAEELHYLALYERRRARRALRRRELFDRFMTHWTLAPWPPRVRRR
jgi:hypothetical protein